MLLITYPSENKDSSETLCRWGIAGLRTPAGGADGGGLLRDVAGRGRRYPGSCPGISPGTGGGISVRGCRRNEIGRREGRLVCAPHAAPVGSILPTMGRRGQRKSFNSRCRRCRVKKMRLFTVPMGRSSFSAISRYLKPATCMEKGMRYSLGKAFTTRCISFRS